MNSWLCIVFSGGVIKTSIFPVSFLTSFLSVYLIGCSDQEQLLSAEQVTKYENALPARLIVAMEYVGKAKMAEEPYQVGEESKTANEQRHPLKTSA